jgi:arylsulfatase A-like enzyme
MRLTRLRFVICVSAMLALCCGGKPERINVIIIGVDTLRSDHLGCYGYARETSPNIDALAAQGVLCERCTSQAPWTLPSFATVFTSLYPTQHGANVVGSKLRTSFKTLAEILKEHGYATGAVVNAPALKPATDADRGFDTYHMTPLDGRIGAGTTEDALTWLDSIGDSSFFAFVHYFDPHLSYSPPPPYDKRFTAPYEGRIGYSFNLEGFSRVRDTMFVQMRDLTEGDWARIVDLYDGEIAYTDSAIAALLRGLDRRNLRDNTLIVFLSDHGEEFFEHGGFEHGHSLYDELLHVPLFFILPERIPAGVRLSRAVRLLDVAPTILDFLAIEPPPHFEGVSLRPVLQGQGQYKETKGSILPHDAAYAEWVMHLRQKKCVVVYPWKLVHELGTENQMLFNLAEDPEEMQNLVDECRDQAANMENLIFQAMFGMDDTWYIEMTTGDERKIVDVEVLAQKGPMPGNIFAYRLLDRNGRIVDPQGSLSISASNSLLRLEDFALKGSLTLAFKFYPPDIPVRFNLKIDGHPAMESTFLGEALEIPEAMPFSIQSRRGRVDSPGRPDIRQESPHFLVWYEESDYRGDTRINLDEETKKELRALGYIQ